MSELEEKLNTLLSNPQLMQQIAAMAQTMGENTPQPPHEQPSAPPALPDPKILSSLAQAMGQSRVDNDQKALLKALSPYVSQGRIHKLERAMGAARLANAASSFFNSGGLQLLSGR